MKRISQKTGPALLAGALLVLSTSGPLVLAHGRQPPTLAPQPPRTVRYTDIGQSVNIIGAYGQPLGTYLMLQGRRVGTAVNSTKSGPDNFLVEKVNGKALASPISATIERVGALPAGTPCTVEGYETGEMVGVSADVVAHMGGVQPQTALQFRVRFVSLKVRR